MEILLPSGHIALVDDNDWLMTLRYKWRVNKDRCGILYVQADTPMIGGVKRTIKLHRFIMNAYFNQKVDHKNGDGLDNRRENLRVCSESQNHMNQRKTHGISKYKGVTKNYKKWTAKIKLNKKDICLGSFDREEDAAVAYDEAASKLFGEFAHLNFGVGE